MEEGSNHNEKVMFMLGEMRGDIKSILEQARKTNGRVSVLEDKVDEHKRFIDGLKTKVALVSSGISLLGFVAWEWVKSKFFS